MQIHGGLFPGSYREEYVKVKNVPEGEMPYDTVKNWCKSNFPDWNHIGTTHGMVVPESKIKETLAFVKDIPVFV